MRLADDPGGQLVAPGRFLPAAERYGLIREIDRMVLGKVTTLLAGEHGGRACGSRSTARRCRSPTGGCSRRSKRGSRWHRVDPAQLVIEVTETAAISDMARAQDFCAGVQALGCAVALDDFGAGFGSFQYLKHLPFEYLKIDGDFIRGLPDSPKDQLVVKALVELARGMGKQTIAEYVDDAATVRAAARLRRGLRPGVSRWGARSRSSRSRRRSGPLLGLGELGSHRRVPDTIRGELALQDRQARRGRHRHP